MQHRAGVKHFWQSARKTYLLYKCPEVKSTDFKSQEKRERMVGKTVGVHKVGGGGGAGGFAGRKKERNFELEIEHQTS